MPSPPRALLTEGIDTIRDAVDSAEFEAGLRTGLVALAAALVLGTIWRYVLRRRRPLPVGGVLAAAAGAAALRDGDALPDRALLGLVVLALGAFGVGMLGLRARWLVIAGAPGALVLASAVTDDPSWFPQVVGVTAVLGGAALASFDRRTARLGLGPLVAASWVVGVYLTVPDTEAPLALLAPLALVAVAGWPLRLVSVGATGSPVLAGLIAWSAVVGGIGRPASVVGAVASAGLLVIEPVARSLSRDRSVVDVVDDAVSRLVVVVLVVAVVQAVLVYVAARVAGLEHEVRTAVTIVAAELVVGTVVAVVVARRARPKGARPKGAR